MQDLLRTLFQDIQKKTHLYHVGNRQEWIPLRIAHYELGGR